MGVDHDGVGGIGIEVTDEVISKLIKLKRVEKLWKDNPYECLEELRIPFSEGGEACYGGEARFYWLVAGNNLEEINKNSVDFINKLKELGYTISIKDLKVIQDIHMW